MSLLDRHECRELREKAGVPRRLVAAAVGCNLRTVERWENGLTPYSWLPHDVVYRRIVEDWRKTFTPDKCPYCGQTKQVSTVSVAITSKENDR